MRGSSAAMRDPLAVAAQLSPSCQHLVAGVSYLFFGRVASQTQTNGTPGDTLRDAHGGKSCGNVGPIAVARRPGRCTNFGYGCEKLRGRNIGEVQTGCIG